jgi:hypothetical protein
MEYVSPGDAFSSSLERSLLLRAQAQRQALEDDLASKREARLNQAELDSAQERQDRIRQHGEDQKQAAHDKTVAELEKRTSKMVPGDIPDPEMMATADKVGVSGTMFPKPAESMPGVAAVPLGAVRMGVAGPADASVRPYLGDAKQRQDADEKAAVAKLIAAMPDGPQRQAIEMAVATGVRPTVDMFKPQGGADEGQAVARVDPQRKVVQRLVNGQWTDVAGDVPKGTHFLQEPTPPVAKDNSFQQENQRIAAHKTATTALDKAGTPYESKLGELEAVDAMINERSVSADAHLAPMLLKALVAGTGSGFRMTQAEIQQVQNARTKWQSMEAAFRKWNADPKDALFFDDKQRQEFSNLVTMMRKVTARHLEPINAARNDVDTAETPREIQQRMTKLHEDRSKGSKDEKADEPPTAPKRIRYDINGKVIQ